MTRFNPAQLVLSAVCAGLALLLCYLLIAPLPEIGVPQVQVRSAPADDDDDVNPVARFDAPPKQAFAEVDERLVFNPARTKVVAPSQPGASNAANLPSDLSLVGVILDDYTKLALFKSPTEPLAVGVGVGGSIEGWQVTRIEPDSVALRASGPEQVIRLSANKAPATGPNQSPQRPFGPPNFPRPPNFARNNPNNPNNVNNNNNNNNNDDNDDDNDNN